MDYKPSEKIIPIGRSDLEFVKIGTCPGCGTLIYAPVPISDKRYAGIEDKIHAIERRLTVLGQSMEALAAEQYELRRKRTSRGDRKGE